MAGKLHNKKEFTDLRVTKNFALNTLLPVEDNLTGLHMKQRWDKHEQDTSFYVSDDYTSDCDWSEPGLPELRGKRHDDPETLLILTRRVFVLSHCCFSSRAPQRGA